MSGLMRLEQVQSPVVSVFDNLQESEVSMKLESYFQDIERVQNVLEVADSPFTSKSEIALADYQLSTLQSSYYIPLRMENNVSEKETLKYRAEGILSSIWEKIVALWNWIIDKIKSVFGFETKEATSEQRSEAKKVLEKVEPQIKFSGLHGLERITGFGDFKEVKDRLNEIRAQYTYLGTFSKYIYEDFVNFFKKDILASLITLTALKPTYDYLEVNGSRSFSEDGKEKIYYVGRNKAFTINVSYSPPKATATLTKSKESKETEFSFTSKEMQDLLQVIQSTLKSMDKQNMFFKEDFSKSAETIKEAVEKFSKEPKQGLAKNKLTVIKGFNELALIALKIAKEYKITSDSLKNVEMSLLSKITKPTSGNFKDDLDSKVNKTMKDLEDPNVKTIVL
jgi:hypothetical protein